MIELKVIVNKHDWLGGFLRPQVSAGPFEFNFDTSSGIGSLLTDPSASAGEGSLAAHLLRIYRGDRSFVGIPLFVVRRFRHRTFYVPADSKLRALEDLRGLAVGIGGWTTSGNTWSREALMDAGVHPSSVRWLVEGPARPDLPSYAEPANGTMMELLASRRVEAIVSGDPYVDLRRTTPDLRHLLPDFVASEESYYRRRRVFPAHHILLVRQEVARRWPEVLHLLFELFSTARRQWFEARWRFADEDGTPWAAVDLERALAEFRGSWFRDGFGYTDTERTVRALAAQQVVEGLSSIAVEPADAFAEYLQA